MSINNLSSVDAFSTQPTLSSLLQTWRPMTSLTTQTLPQVSWLADLQDSGKLTPMSVQNNQFIDLTSTATRPTTLADYYA